MSQDKIFADGFILKAHDKNGWVNLNVLNSKGGTAYIELDQFVPKKSQDKAPAPAPVKEEEEEDELPF